jgi:hypothetical protein
MASDAQIEANQTNAQLSTGPTSSTGKSKSSLNAVKTGLTGRTVLLPGDDAEAYQKHVDSFFDRWKPADDNERNLVQCLADTEWRLLRIPALEMGIYAIGRLEFASEFASEDESVRKHLIEAKVFLAYRKDLNNLSIQESRLREAARNPWVIWYPGQLDLTNIDMGRSAHGALMSVTGTTPGNGPNLGEAIAIDWTARADVKMRKETQSAEAQLHVKLTPAKATPSRNLRR